MRLHSIQFPFLDKKIYILNDNIIYHYLYIYSIVIEDLKNKS